MAGILKDWLNSSSNWRIVADELSKETARRRQGDPVSGRLQDVISRWLPIHDRGRVKRALEKLDLIGSPSLSQEQSLELLASIDAEDSPIPQRLAGGALDQGLGL